MKKICIALLLILTACGPTIKAQRMTTSEGDKKAMTITDDWVATDTNLAVDYITDKLTNTGRYKRYLRENGYKTPKIFIGEVENNTSEDSFPISALNNKILDYFFESGDFDVIDQKNRKKLLEEIRYQNSGMVKEEDIKSIGKASGADLILFGEVIMDEKRMGGQTLKEYSVIIKLTNIESGEEVSRVTYETTKYSKQKRFSL